MPTVALGKDQMHRALFYHQTLTSTENFDMPELTSADPVVTYGGSLMAVNLCDS